MKNIDYMSNSYFKIKSPDSPNEKKRLTRKTKKKSNKNKIKPKIPFYKKYIRYILVLSFFCIIFIIIISLIILPNKQNSGDTIKISTNPLISKDPELEFKDSQEYYKMSQNCELYEKDKIYNPTNNPKISIVLPVHNGEYFLKKTLTSIQNQDFKDIEIIIVDDQSTDNSVELIKELMKTEPRIKFHQNEENKGILYTKAKGVLLAKGKYVMTLDDDDNFLQRDAFTTLYEESEKENLDILKFRTIQTTMFSVKELYNHAKNDESPIIYQPELSNYMYRKRSDGNIMQNGGNLCNQIFRTDLFQKVIKEIDQKYLNIKMNNHDDFLLFFLLTRSAKSLKEISRVFYVISVTKFIHEPKVDYRRKEKNVNRDNLACQAYLMFIEIIFNKTKDTIDDKKIAFSQLQTWYMGNECRNNIETRENFIKLSKLFLDNKYIEEKDKETIKIFIDRIKHKD